MICCADENLKKDSFKYLKQFTKVFVGVSLYHFSGNLFGSSLNVSPYILIDAIIIILSYEKETISDIGAITTILIMEELHSIFMDNVCFYCFILQLNI